MMKKFLAIACVGFVVGVSTQGAEAALEGQIRIDGSSTVFPVSEAVAEEASKDSRFKKVRIGVSFSGTGGGFKKFCKGEIDITGASRPIKQKEVEACAKAGAEYVELPVAFDGVAVVVNKANKCADTLSVAELKKIWGPAAEGKITNWKQVKASCPDMPLVLFGPGHDSGTFDYFTEAVMGESKSSRPDFSASEDDNVLVLGVSQNPGAIGYFGFAYYESNKEKVKLVKVDGGTGPIAPTIETISSGAYTPLSRPLFIYISKKSAERPEVEAFVQYYLKNVSRLAQEVGYASLGGTDAEIQSLYGQALKAFEKRSTGTYFTSNEASRGMTVEKVLQSKQ